jgi:hypothetical protein
MKTISRLILAAVGLLLMAAALLLPKFSGSLEVPAVFQGFLSQMTFPPFPAVMYIAGALCMAVGLLWRKAVVQLPEFSMEKLKDQIARMPKLGLTPALRRRIEQQTPPDPSVDSDQQVIVLPDLFEEETLTNPSISIRDSDIVEEEAVEVDGSKWEGDVWTSAPPMNPTTVSKPPPIPHKPEITWDEVNAMFDELMRSFDQGNHPSQRVSPPIHIWMDEME